MQQKKGHKLFLWLLQIHIAYWISISYLYQQNQREV